MSIPEDLRRRIDRALEDALYGRVLPADGCTNAVTTGEPETLTTAKLMAILERLPPAARLPDPLGFRRYYGEPFPSPWEGLPIAGCLGAPKPGKPTESTRWTIAAPKFVVVT